MIREDRELLAEPARANSDVVPLTMRVMDSASAEEQHELAARLIGIGQRLDRRAEVGGHVIEGDAVSVVDAPTGTVSHRGP